MKSPAPFKLRAAEPRDVPAIVGLIRELAEFEKLTHLVKVTPESLMPQLFGARPAAEALVVEVGEVGEEGGEGEATEVAAFALFFTNFSTFLGLPGIYLEDLYVRPAHRGSGLGTTLLTRLAQIAVERGCGRFEWSVLDWNENAIRFYKSMGADVMTEWQICRVTGERLARLGAAAA